jgi:hypothetical protein
MHHDSHKMGIEKEHRNKLKRDNMEHAFANSHGSGNNTTAAHDYVLRAPFLLHQRICDLCLLLHSYFSHVGQIHQRSFRM